MHSTTFSEKCQGTTTTQTNHGTTTTTTNDDDDDYQQLQWNSTRQTGCGDMTSLFAIYHASRLAYKQFVRELCVWLSFLSLSVPLCTVCVLAVGVRSYSMWGQWFFNVSSSFWKRRTTPGLPRCDTHTTHMCVCYTERPSPSNGTWNARDSTLYLLKSGCDRPSNGAAAAAAEPFTIIHTKHSALHEKPTHDTLLRWLSGCRKNRITCV